MSLSDFDGLETLKIFFQEDLFKYNDIFEVCEATDEFKIVGKKMVITVVKKMADLIK